MPKCWFQPILVLKGMYHCFSNSHNLRAISPFLKPLAPEESKCSNARHDYSVSQLWNKVFGNDHLVSNFIDDAIKLMHVQYYKRNEYTRAQFCCLVCGILASGKLLKSPKEAVADPLPKHLLFGW